MTDTERAKVLFWACVGVVAVAFALAGWFAKGAWFYVIGM